ncbi:hypothetical protein [Candidatus Uabimicrobium sp. HlEnr_7]
MFHTDNRTKKKIPKQGTTSRKENITPSRTLIQHAYDSTPLSDI